MRKQVGNGTSIKFFHDPWIPKDNTFKPLRIDHSITNDNLLVADLIKPSKEWNVQKLKELVSEVDANIISAIPISLGNDEDRWIWHYSKNGKYPVKIGYTVAIMSNVDIASSSVNILKNWWGTLWG